MEQKIQLSKSQSLEKKDNSVGKRLFKITWPIYIESDTCEPVYFPVP